jgi:hypothetical protein
MRRNIDFKWAKDGLWFTEDKLGVKHLHIFGLRCASKDDMPDVKLYVLTIGKLIVKWGRRVKQAKPANKP